MKRTTSWLGGWIGIATTGLLGLGSLLPACGDGSHTIATGAGGGSHLATGGSGGGDGGSDATGGSGGSSTQNQLCSGDSTQLVNTHYNGICKPDCSSWTVKDSSYCPASVPQAPDCTQNVKSRPAEECGVLLPIDRGTPGSPVELTRTTSTKEFMGSGPPDLACFTAGSRRVAGTPTMVTVTGWARNFANGCDSKGAKIEIYKVKRTGGADDGALGDLVGTAVEVDDTSMTKPEAVTKCSTMASGERLWRGYSYPNVPSETELLVKTSKTTGDFVDLYDYNLYIPNDQVTNGVYAHDVRVIDSGDYTLIPSTAGVMQIHAGFGAIAGEIHDCGDVRLSGATVDVSSKRDAVGYFTNEESDPLPDMTVNSTSQLGTYAAYNTPAGRVRVSAVGVLGGELVGLGYFDVVVFPDTITAVTFHGLQPFQGK